MKHTPYPLPRRAIVLAAGDGGRLAGHMDAMPKPLVPLGGKPLIEYTLDAAAANGIEEVLIVTGYREPEVRQQLLRTPRPFALSFASNPLFEGGASYSLRAAREFGIEEPSLLLMADHLFGAELLGALISAHAELPSAAHASLVAADTCPRDAAYTDEATKLALADDIFPGEVIAIGKQLAEWDALECGAFVLDPEAWTAVDEAPRDCELSTIFGMLAGSGSLYAADTSGLPWYDVDTPADLVAAAQYLQPEWFGRGEGIEA